jgi:hypothetical protein
MNGILPLVVIAVVLGGPVLMLWLGHRASLNDRVQQARREAEMRRFRAKHVSGTCDG